MALNRVLPGLKNKTLLTGKTKFNSDVDLSFTAKPGTPTSYDSSGVGQDFKGDIYKKTDVAAVLQSVENILLTNTQEKPFEPSFGGNLRSLLFESSTKVSEPFVTRIITKTLQRWEPRVEVKNITYLQGEKIIESGSSDLLRYSSNDLRIKLDLNIKNISFEETVTTTINLNRLR
jgi:phage baseplate assembly protein W